MDDRVIALMSCQGKGEDKELGGMTGAARDGAPLHLSFKCSDLT